MIRLGTEYHRVCIGVLRRAHAQVYMNAHARVHTYTYTHTYMHTCIDTLIDALIHTLIQPPGYEKFSIFVNFPDGLSATRTVPPIHNEYTNGEPSRSLNTTNAGRVFKLLNKSIDPSSV